MKLFFNFIFAIIIFYSVSSVADNLSIGSASAATKLHQQLTNIKTLQANFSQESYDAKNNLLQKQNGNFKVMQSGEFIWNIAAPYEQKIISDGKVLTIFDPDLDQATIKPLDKKAQIVPLLLFGGEIDEITRQYNISNLLENTFELSSKSKSSLFEKLQISFVNEKPVLLSITDSMNQKTVVRFDNVIVNQILKTSLFQFEAPAGADVFDERH